MEKTKKDRILESKTFIYRKEDSVDERKVFITQVNNDSIEGIDLLKIDTEEAKKIEATAAILADLIARNMSGYRKFLKEKIN